MGEKEYDNFWNKTVKYMMKKKGIALVMAATVVLGQCNSVFTIQAEAAQEETTSNSESKEGVPLKEKYTGFNGTEVVWDYASSDDMLSYETYEQAYAEVAKAVKTIDIPLSDIKDKAGSLEIQKMEGKDAVLSSKNSEYIEFEVAIDETAMYRMELDYYLVAGSSDAGKRALYIDGEYPFIESGDIVFDRYFHDAGEPVINSIGDETRPKQIEIPGWRSAGLIDTVGSVPSEFNLYLEKGTHTIRLVYMKTDMYISAIRLTTPKMIPTYAEVKASYEEMGYQEANAETIHFQAELTAVEKNDPTLRRENDGDPLNEPVSNVNRKLNVIGGYRWRSGNQSITWEFEVPEDGLYKIGMYVKQSWNDGLPSYRQIAIDSEVPFQELLEYKFAYNTKWTHHTLADANGEAFEFYLTAGKHQMTMTVKMGDLTEVLESIQDDILVLSEMLLDINMIAGSEPDPNYDYGFFEKIPTMEQDMYTLIESMEYKYELVKSLSQKTPAMANNFLTIKSQIESMVKNPYSIAKKIGDLENSQESLGEWYLSLQSVPLVLDYFDIGSPKEEWKSVSSNIFSRLAVTAKQFISSFTKDYDNVGGVLSDDVEVHTVIDVWIARGTEWAEVIKEMADEDFTPKTGIAIDVNVLPASQINAGNVNALMLSITSGKAPDVALGVDVTSPVEFAIRDQVYDLSQFEGFEEVKDRFVEATLTPYEYQSGTFAIPETMNFNVLYYRKDILSEYGIDIPNTRQELYEYVLPALYQEGLNYYFNRDFTQFLFQNGGSFYTEDGMKTALDTQEAYAAFKEYTELWTNYGILKTANFYQQMRNGVMPLGVGDFNMYMQLSVAAPEIAGKWGIAPLPGVLKEDGTIDRTAGAITDKGDIIMKQSEYPEESWEFLKWWSSTEVQTQFAKEVEALMGAEARWNTANKDAFMSLSWNEEDIAVIQEQWKWAQETPTVLGGYMTTRHMTNAWTSVVISGVDVREALEQAVKDINRELRTKQEEYGVISDE